MYVYEAMYLTSQGQMKTNGPVNYKIPGVRNIPRKFNVTLLKDSKIEKSVYSSKVIAKTYKLKCIVGKFFSILARLI